jgi:hypothetical protein
VAFFFLVAIFKSPPKLLWLFSVMAVTNDDTELKGLVQRKMQPKRFFSLEKTRFPLEKVGF